MYFWEQGLVVKGAEASQYLSQALLLADDLRTHDSASAPGGPHADSVPHLLLASFPFPHFLLSFVFPFALFPSTQNVMWSRGCGWWFTCQLPIILSTKPPKPWWQGKHSNNNEAFPSSWEIFVRSKKLSIMVIVVPFFKNVFLFNKMTFCYV